MPPQTRGFVIWPDATAEKNQAGALFFQEAEEKLTPTLRQTLKMEKKINYSINHLTN
jgi:hypothetical protein